MWCAQIVDPPAQKKLIHSKKNGEGYIDSPAKVQKILEGIAAAMR